MASLSAWLYSFISWLHARKCTAFSNTPACLKGAINLGKCKILFCGDTYSDCWTGSCRDNHRPLFIYVHAVNLYDLSARIVSMYLFHSDPSTGETTQKAIQQYLDRHEGRH